MIVGSSIVVWFSCGAASAVAAKKTIENYGHVADVIIVNNPVMEEDADNRRFLTDVSAWLDRPILQAKHRLYPNASAEEIWDKRSYMNGIEGAPCTMLLKREARYQFQAKHRVDWHVLGFTADEEKRHNRFIQTETSNVLPVLIDECITKPMCFDILHNAGIRLPRAYYAGYPNANCIGCVKATSATYWNHVRRMDPKVFASRAQQSRKLGVKLVRYKGERIFLDELPINATGRPMKNMDIDCGIFCEEKL